MLTFQDCVKIGAFTKPYGYSGTLLLRFDPEWEASLESAERVITEINGLPVPWFTAHDGIRITSSQSALVDLDWIEDQETAEKLCGHEVYLLKEDLVIQAPNQEHNDLTGYQVVVEDGLPIGTIIRTENFSGNLVMILETPHGEKMVPLHEDLVVEHNTALRTLKMNLPDGLLEL